MSSFGLERTPYTYLVILQNKTNTSQEWGLVCRACQKNRLNAYLPRELMTNILSKLITVSENYFMTANIHKNGRISV